MTTPKAAKSPNPKQSPSPKNGRGLEPDPAIKKLGIYDTSSIKDRIGKWQSLTVSDLPPQDLADPKLGSKDSASPGKAPGELSSSVPKTTSPRKPRTPQKSPDKVAPEAGAEHPRADQIPTFKPATPKRRLVSDGHWKKTKTPLPEKKTPAKATPNFDAEPRARPDAWVRPKATPLKVDGASPLGKPHSPAKAGNPSTPVAVPAPLRSLAKTTPSPDKIDPAEASRFEPVQDQLAAPVVLNAKNLRGLSREPGDVREAERDRRAQYHPALQYFAGKPISDPPPPLKVASPPKKPADIRPTLEFFAGRIKPSKARGDGGAQNEKDDRDGAQSKNLASDQSRSQDEPVGRIEAWLGDSTDPFVNKQSDAVHKSQRKNVIDQGANHERSAEAEEERRRRRERRKMAHRYDHAANQPRIDQHQIQDDDKTPRSTPKSQEDSASDSPATSSLKRRGAKREQQSPRRRVDNQPPPGKTKGRAPSPPETLLSGLHTIRPDDSASMMFFRPEATREKSEHKSPTPSGASATKQRTVQSTALVLGSPVPMQGVHARPGAAPDTDISNRPLKKRSTRKRKLTSHGDLISVLSETAPLQGSLVSACSVKSSRSKPGQASIADLMAELNRDERKYMQELHTLIDGVIPVLLTTVLAKDNTVESTNFVFPNNAVPSATTPIIDMGVALERLRSVHKRMPLENSDAMMFWGPQAHRVYIDYIKTWRLGFEDIIVNLAPAAAGNPQAEQSQQSSGETFERHLTDDKESRSRIDVAYLLKRPLVRVKHLSKTFKGMSLAKNSSLAEELSRKYHDLVEAARMRQQEEKGRLEDVAAASIDASRARDPLSLAPLAGVRIDPHKCVRARDFFNLRLLHSSGQRIDCHVELVLRDDVDSRYPGDLLICEVDSASRWLFLPPVKLDCVSARHGESPGEIVVLIRNSQYSAKHWQELISLHAQDTQTASEWMSMLGTIPVPPSISLPPPPAPASTPAQGVEETPLLPSSPMQALTLPQSSHSAPDAEFNEVHVPFGEQASVLSRRWESPVASETSKVRLPDPPAINGDQRASTVRPGHKPASASQSASFISVPRSAPRPSSARPSSLIGPDSQTSIWSPSSSPTRQGRTRDSKPETQFTHPTPNVADYDRMRRFVNGEKLSEVSRESRPPHKYSASAESLGRGNSSWLPWKASRSKRDVAEDEERSMSPEKPPLRQSRPKSESIVSRNSRKDVASEAVAHPVELSPSSHAAPNPGFLNQKPASPMGSTSSLTDYSQKTPQRKQPSVSTSNGQAKSPGSSPVARGARPMEGMPTSKPAAQFTPSSPGQPWQRRSSSPLKHEYEPSTASDDSFDGRIETDIEDDAASVSSASSAEDIVPSLPPMDLFNRRHKPSHSVYVPKNPGTIAPSQSASQVPYQAFPENNAGGDKKIASIFCWSDKGAWEPLHPDECSIVVSPGLIEAYPMSASHSGLSKSDPLIDASPYFSPRPEGVSPLVGLELTPLVPLRRGTAIDISIRSPPTKESTVKTPSSNIMFRSRNNIECEHLYNAINQARINNPTYIAMQNARPGPESSWAAYMDSRPSERVPWWRLGRRKSTYRAGSSRRTPSVAAQTHETESSVATMTSALSALRRFTGGSKMFNLSKSTVTHGSGPGHSMFSRSSGTSSSGALGSDRGRSGASTPPAGVGVGLDGGGGAALGIKGAKIRLYSREAAGRWRDMGSARLTVMQPSRPAGAPPPITQDGRLEQEKRVVVEGRGKARVLLDVTLGESAFERVARTGIALSVWERIEEVRNRGGVGGVRVKVYMLQMKSEAEAAYMFSIVGRLRY